MRRESIDRLRPTKRTIHFLYFSLVYVVSSCSTHDFNFNFLPNICMSCLAYLLSKDVKKKNVSKRYGSQNRFAHYLYYPIFDFFWWLFVVCCVCGVINKIKKGRRMNLVVFSFTHKKYQSDDETLSLSLSLSTTKKQSRRLKMRYTYIQSIQSNMKFKSKSVKKGI